MEAQTSTDFSILNGGSSAAEVYSGVSTVAEATADGPYEKNTDGLKKPEFVLVRYKPPKVKGW